ncbi:MAG: cobaltochelatase subunit CobN [Alphaproteobacteria bacterium]
MHLLAATPGGIADGSEAVDLGQTPADIVVISAADSELSCLAVAHRSVRGPTLRLANLMHLTHNLSVDRYLDQVISRARLVVVRLLGGRSYWPYGVEQIDATCRARGIPVVFLPGDDSPDAELSALCTVPPEAAHRLWQYCVHGGPGNAGQFLRFAASLLDDKALSWLEPVPLPPAGLYPAGGTLAERVAQWRQEAPTAIVVFYRSLVQAANTSVVDALLAALTAQGLNTLAMHVTSLKDPVAAATVAEILAQARPDVILNATGFAVSTPGRIGESRTPFTDSDCPVLQVVFAGTTEAAWREGTQGLSARDIAMNVALPEVDGRILARAVSFKSAAERDEATETDIITYRPVADRVEFTARLAAAWATLRRTPIPGRRVALVLANYPNRDGRLGNGVGLDTPASTVDVLAALALAGYDVRDRPADGATLMATLMAGPTNDLRARSSRTVRETLPLSDYLAFFRELPEATQAEITARWGEPAADPHFLSDEEAFALAAVRFGRVAVAVQPARGYNIDPAASYHDPALVPPHGYLAFHVWMRDVFRAQAVVHMGKHGNLEWLPGKSLALSSGCYPEVALGPLPNLYPFIVNDPGEGTQAKRRAQAVIVDHLTPPLTRAESYGPLCDLEQRVDEYYEAAGVDPRRLAVLQEEILSLCRTLGLDTDCGIAPGEDTGSALTKLDNHLCELKELQIRDGLHTFGTSPEGDLLTDLLVALCRVPRGQAPHEASLLRALAADLGLSFDPLDCPLGDPWSGARPEILAAGSAWRTVGDTVERLERLARDLIGGTFPPDPSWRYTRPVLEAVAQGLRPAVAACGAAEMKGLLAGLDGRFVAPGPSGAPTRGRPDVLPTGRNFYSVDTRTVPTPAAWHLGWKSATLLIERHLQDHGDWPRSVAMTAWGTSNMRTGGDDIAQALALMGTRPTWDSASRRVTGFEILPQSVLGRPRVDVTLRVSGFFRDAFPSLIDLFDSVVRAVSALDEEGDDVNPLAAHTRQETARLVASGIPAADAVRRAGYRVFGSRPGAYGAGLQALIDERGWRTDADLARAYVAWGGYAYGAGAVGHAEHGLFETRLKSAQAVIQNQDNREHDLLDSDDYYQFEGGMTAAVRLLSGQQPVVYHADHARPETPRIRTLEEEIARIVRARAANPKWIRGVMRHGYKGAFEMAATVDYLFAFAATARCVRDHHFDALFDAYLSDDEVREFIEEVNPAALKEMAARFQEAIDRGLWHPRRNDTAARIDGVLETPASGPSSGG